jgi:hypothetical protein
MKREMTTAARAAKAIRMELKAKFSGIKFSVTSENYSMGDSVRIRWTDGTRSMDVDAIVMKYQYGDFDGMRDLYENTNVIEGLPQVKFVFTNREISEERRAKAKALFVERFKIDPDDFEAVKEKLHSYDGARREIGRILEENEV